MGERMRWLNLLAAFTTALLISDNGYAVVGEGAVSKIVVIEGKRSDWCYKAIREMRPFDRLYKSRSLYRYHFIDTVNCAQHSYPLEHIPDAVWSIIEVDDDCYEVLRIPLQTTIGIYSPDRREWEDSWGAQITCP